MSRDFAVWDGPAGMLSVAGGKLTTYRRMAEVVTDIVARRLGVTTRCRTRRFKLTQGSQSLALGYWRPPLRGYQL